MTPTNSGLSLSAAHVWNLKASPKRWLAQGSPVEWSLRRSRTEGPSGDSASEGPSSSGPGPQRTGRRISGLPVQFCESLGWCVCLCANTEPLKCYDTGRWDLVNPAVWCNSRSNKESPITITANLPGRSPQSIFRKHSSISAKYSLIPVCSFWCRKCDPITFRANSRGSKPSQKSRNRWYR